MESFFVGRVSSEKTVPFGLLGLIVDLMMTLWVDPEELKDVFPVPAEGVVWVHVPPVSEGIACAT